MMKVIPELHKKYIKGTEKKALVQLVQVLLCHLTSAVIKATDSNCNRVYINTRVIKHVYDKRTAEEFDFLIEHVHLVVKYPGKIYKNKNGKRGSFLFYKEIKGSRCVCSLEVLEKEETLLCEIVTFFRTTEDYLRSYELLWEWEDGAPPS